MYVPMPFPYCRLCRKKWDSYAIHKNCGGVLELDPDAKTIRCTKCHGEWPLWESIFHCPRDHSFEANEIEIAVNELIDDCKLVAEELELMSTAYWRRTQMAQESKREFVRNSLEDIGYSASRIAGYLFEKIVDFILDLFKGQLFH